MGSHSQDGIGGGDGDSDGEIVFDGDDVSDGENEGDEVSFTCPWTSVFRFQTHAILRRETIFIIRRGIFVPEHNFCFKILASGDFAC